MHYNEYLPDEQLAPYIKCFWTLESSEEDTGPHTRERIFPDGCIELIFHHGDLFRKYAPDDSFELQPRWFFHGQLKTHIEIEATGRIAMFSVRFQPGGLYPFVNFDISAINDATATVEEIWGEEGRLLGESMFNAADMHERLETITCFLRKKLLSPPDDMAIVQHCVEALRRHDGNITIETLADELRINKRVLERKFVAGVGLSPKFLARIIRFNKALQLIENKDFSSFTSVAYEGGFYDQAHFIRDFKEFTGLNPKQYFSENLEMVRFFSLE